MVLGISHSALRGMAFEKAVVVVGEQGFVKPISAETTPYFLHHGIYGIGTDSASPMPQRMAEQLRPLVADPGRRAAAGSVGRALVERRFSIDAAADTLEQACVESLRRRAVRSWAVDAARILRAYAPAKVRRLCR